MNDLSDRPLFHSFYLDTDADGKVFVRVVGNARRFTMRFSNGAVVMSAPAGQTCSQVLAAYRKLRPSLHIGVAARCYSIGQEIAYPEGSIRIMSATDRQGLLRLRGSGIPAVTIPAGFDIADARNNKAVTTAIMRLAKPRAANILLPQARRRASELGLRVSEWVIGTGLRTLGTCSADRVITLSAACLFLPHDLRDYIVCHELAHLTEMNHSSRFHDLCDSYLHGREKELIAKLKAFSWPVIR